MAGPRGLDDEQPELPVAPAPAPRVRTCERIRGAVAPEPESCARICAPVCTRAGYAGGLLICCSALSHCVCAGFTAPVAACVRCLFP